jgi:DNA-binding NarL/FixJ family response regulator
MIPTWIVGEVRVARQKKHEGDPVPPKDMEAAWALDLDGRLAELAVYLARGKSLRQASESMHVAYGTAVTYRSRLYRRLDINSVAELCALFHHQREQAPPAPRQKIHGPGSNGTGAARRTGRAARSLGRAPR